MKMLSPIDLNQLQEKGITEEQVKHQIGYFEKGFPYLKLKKAACVGDGIIKIPDDQVKDYMDFYDKNLGTNLIVKFVPASGAASRMFKDFFGLMHNPDKTEEFHSAVDALQRVGDFAFFEQLKSVMSENGLDLEQAIADKNYQVVLEYILTEKGLNYGFLPKGLLSFHKYSCRTKGANGGAFSGSC